jgi:hypothetical protein
MGWRAQRFECTPLTIVIEGVEPFAEALRTAWIAAPSGGQAGYDRRRERSRGC